MCQSKFKDAKENFCFSLNDIDCLSYVYKKWTAVLSGCQPSMGKVMSSNSGTEKHEPLPSTLTAILFQGQNIV